EHGCAKTDSVAGPLRLAHSAATAVTPSTEERTRQHGRDHGLPGPNVGDDHDGRGAGRPDRPDGVPADEAARRGMRSTRGRPPCFSGPLDVPESGLPAPPTTGEARLCFRPFCDHWRYARLLEPVQSPISTSTCWLCRFRQTVSRTFWFGGSADTRLIR